MDEFTAIELLESLHETIANPRQHEHNATQITRLRAREPGTLDIVAQVLSGNIVRSIRFSLQSLKHRRFISKQLVKLAVRRLPRLTAANSAGDEQHTRFKASPGSARVFEGGFYHRSVLDKFISIVPGANMDHALAVVCGEATRAYLANKDGLENVNLSAQLQVDLRNAGAHALSGNKMALQHIELYTGVDNLVERLYAIVGSNVSASEDELERRGHDIRAVYENIPAPLLSMIGRWSKHELRSLEAGGSCGISTLVGPDQPVYLLGAKLSGLTSVSPLYKGCGLMYSASQYGDKIALSFTSGRDILPDPENLMACLRETMEQIDLLSENESC